MWTTASNLMVIVFVHCSPSIHDVNLLASPMVLFAVAVLDVFNDFFQTEILQSFGLKHNVLRIVTNLCRRFGGKIIETIIRYCASGNLCESK
ncbi:hypothetical protein IQ07DRAFT_589710 [Pyrenochaeta sp. DS3sAY3a]|nr:hypothetical protein IQ07DRAFT_589710 [Pyrenochaeta sp. DS3sAY3a]